MLKLAKTHDNILMKLKYLWIHDIKQIFIKCAMINVWTEHQFPNSQWLKLTLRHKFKKISLKGMPL